MILDKRLHLVWSDPEDVETWAISPRGAGWLFGSKVTNEVRKDSVNISFVLLHLHIFILLYLVLYTWYNLLVY